MVWSRKGFLAYLSDMITPESFLPVQNNREISAFSKACERGGKRVYSFIGCQFEISVIMSHRQTFSPRS